MRWLWKLISNRLVYKVLSLVIAVIFWIVVQGSQHVEATKEVPLEIVTSDETIPGNEIPKTVSFKLSGPKAFLRAILDRPERPIKVNLSRAKPGLVTYRFFSDNIRLPIGVKVLNINPNAILINLEKVARKKVPVTVDITGAPPEGYKVVETKVDPPTIEIRGAKSRVQAIRKVSTAPIDISEIRNVLETQATLDLQRLKVLYDGDAPNVQIKVRPTSANYRLKNVGVRVLADHRARLSRKAVTVLVRGSKADLKKLGKDQSKVYAIVDLRGVSKGTFERRVEVKLPDAIGFVRAIPSRIAVTLY